MKKFFYLPALLSLFYFPLQAQVSSVCLKHICFQEGVEDANLNIIGDSTLQGVPPFSFNLTANNGCATLNAFPHSSGISVKPIKDDNPLNGVTTYDLVLLSKHIHGIQPFTEPWQWVAADANRDNIIDIQDSIEILKLITGVYLELPNNTTWRFFRSDYVFPSPNPLSQPYPETVTTAELSDTAFVFYGVKIGDLSCSSIPNSGGSAVHTPDYTIPVSVAPNPTNGESIFTLDLPRSGSARLRVYDASGRDVFLYDQVLAAGTQQITVPARAIAVPGMYWWRLDTADGYRAGKLVRH